MRCRMKKQGYPMRKCLTKLADGTFKPTCEAILREKDGVFSRVITDRTLLRLVLLDQKIS